MSVLPPPGPLPTEMRDLLIRLDQKVEDGFHAITAKLDGIERRADNHEQRIRAIETEMADRATLKARFLSMENTVDDLTLWRGSIETTGRVAGTFAKAIWAVAGGGIVGMLGWLITLYAGS